MSALVLELRARRLLQFLVMCAGSGAFGVVLGRRLTPVPGQLFADALEVPLVYLVPVTVAVSLAQWMPVGTWWIERQPRHWLPRIAVVLGTAIASVPEIVVTSASSASLIAMRNTGLLVGVALCARRRASIPATSAVILLPSMIVWTFGWDENGKAMPWALLIAPPASAIAAVLAGVLLVVGLARPGVRSQ